MKTEYLLPSFVCSWLLFGLVSANVAVAQNCLGGCFGYPTVAVSQSSGYQPVYDAPPQYLPPATVMPEVNYAYSAPYYSEQPLVSSVSPGVVPDAAFVGTPTVVLPYFEPSFFGSTIMESPSLSVETIPLGHDSLPADTQAVPEDVGADPLSVESVQGSLSDKIEGDRLQAAVIATDDPVATLQQQLADANSELTSLKNRSEQISEKLAAAKAEVRSAQDRIAATEQSSKAAQRRSKAKLEQVEKNLQEKLSGYEKQQQAYEKKLSEAEEELKVTQEKLAAAEKKLAERKKSSKAVKPESEPKRKTKKEPSADVDLIQSKIDKLNASLKRQIKKAREESDRKLKTELGDLAEKGRNSESQQARAASRKAANLLEERIKSIKQRVERRIEQLKKSNSQS